MSSFRHRNISKGNSFSAPRPPKGPFDYSHCFTRGVPESFSNALTMQPKPGDDFFNLPRAKIEHKNYVTMLQTLLPHMVELPADNACPDCCFVEDVLVAIPPFKVRDPEPQGKEALQEKDSASPAPSQDFPGMAIITRPGAPSRQPEVVPIREALFEVGWPHRLMHEIQAPATLDGGDVLFTGSELWVGLSHRTNQAAIDQLHKLLEPACPVHTFSMEAGGDSTLHLKSVVSLLDETTLLCADNAAGRSIQAQAEAKPGLAGRFAFVGVPDPICCNVLRVGRTVVMQKGYPKSEEVIGPLCKSKGLSLNAVRMGECAKADGALTCCSVLLHVPKQK